MGIRKFTDGQEQEIAARYLAGENCVQLGIAFGARRGVILKVIRRQGVKPRSTGESCRKFTDKQEQEIGQRYAAGENSTQLGIAFGVGHQHIFKILDRLGVKRRNRSEAKRWLSDEQDAEIGRRYIAGENTYQLGEAFGVQPNAIRSALARRGVTCRSTGRARRHLKRKLTDQQEAEVCRRYLEGESSILLGDIFGLQDSTIGRILKRNGVEMRKVDFYGDSIHHALESTGRHSHARECEFYLYELARYSDTHCKPGIAFNVANRIAVGRGEYGAEVLRLVFSTRTEAFFLEQAVLDATRGSAECPEDLQRWDGASEVRAMPADDLLPIIDRLAGELDAMGPWSFAAAYVPMTTAQRATCQQRAIACTSGHH